MQPGVPSPIFPGPEPMGADLWALAWFPGAMYKFTDDDDKETQPRDGGYRPQQMRLSDPSDGRGGYNRSSDPSDGRGGYN